MANPDVRARLADSLDHVLEKDPSHLTATPLEEKWTFIRDSIYNTAMSVVGKKGRRNQDWFESHRSVMDPVITAKRKALSNYKDNPSAKNLAALRNARSTAQKTARRCANDHWQALCQNSRHVLKMATFKACMRE